jgi:hypothetical protein
MSALGGIAKIEAGVVPPSLETGAVSYEFLDACIFLSVDR